jgi:MoaA/NifB/PqqE/SkfB family radical SAM enzyme
MTTESSAMDYWFSIVHLQDSGEQFIENMFDSLGDEYPSIFSVVGERTCALQCAHCIFQAEKSSQALSLSNSLTVAVKTIISQMGANPIFVHEGRMFRPAHLEWLTAVRDLRPDAVVGMIDTGAYLDYATEIKQSDFKFDWLDISIDGTEEVHAQQRKNARSFSLAMEGIGNASRFIRETGRITSLFTLTKINYASVLATCKILPKELTEWHITTISPVRPEISGLSVNDDEFKEAWSQIVSANHIRPVFFRIYVVEDILKLAKAVGKEKFLSAMDDAQVFSCGVSLTIDGVSVLYYPKSVGPNEVFVLDADAHYRMPYSLAYSLEELRSGVSRFGQDIREYTIGKVDDQSQFGVLYANGVDCWRTTFGAKALKSEVAMFQEIHKLQERR